MPDALEARRDRRERLYAQLVEEYREHFAASAAFHEQATTRLVDGGSHTLRLFQPFPSWIRAAQGAWIHDLDGHAILDFWQGHFANILGHNPPVVMQALIEALGHGRGLQCGMQDVWEWELADLICQRVGAEKIRFTTSGSLATMYAILLARGFTGRSLVLKVGGGWHGAQPWGLKGVHFGAQGYQQSETAGLSGATLDEVLITQFNDPQALEDVFRQHGDRIACFIMEPMIGAGGGIPAKAEFLQAARQLTTQYGTLLILDEVINGFRFHAGNLAALYGIQPDLMTLGKIIGGGMPVAAVAGRADVMKLCGRDGGRQVRFEGGTYSSQPLSMLAGKVMIRHLVEHENEIYPHLGQMGAQLRATIQSAFDAEEVLARCTGDGSAVLGGSSLAFLQFPYHQGADMDCPDSINNPALCDVEMRERVAKLAFLLEGVFVVHGFGAISTAHTDDDLERVAQASRAVARRMRAAGI